jgi:UDP-N-acetylglucosamine 1-carboxyvinyltransferase
MKESKILIEGQRKLSGQVTISGAKNAALPELAAVVLSPKPFCFHSVPAVEDIKALYKALEIMGAAGTFESGTIRIQLPQIKTGTIPKEIVETTRASILLLGPMLARNGYARVSLPGGCPIGDRRINYHIEGLEKMGAHIQIESGHITARATQLKGIEYAFPGKTVTGTENLLMAAVLASGPTILRNCALEPEIEDLVALLISMGADIRRQGQDALVIEGKTSLQGAEHTIIPDRIEMGTYVIAGCLGDNEIVVENAVPRYIRSLLEVLESIGASVEAGEDRIKVSSTGSIGPTEIETRPFPGFPTDLQAQLTTLLTQANGISRVRENIFNNRFQHTGELNRLGADIRVEKNTAVITGKTPLQGRVIRATDLRASAALVLGGLMAGGETIVENAHQLFRGYENMPGKLLKLGACVKIIN